MLRTYHAFLLACIAVASIAPVATADPIEDFYHGKTVSLVIGLPAGGGYDAYGRLVARHIGEHISGHPSVVPQNMPGAGGLRAADYLYTAAPKDGSVFGIVASSTLMQPLFNPRPAAAFDASQFSWLGSADSDLFYCGINPRRHIESFDAWVKSGKELTFGASGPAAVTYQYPMVLKNVLGANARVIAGYGGTSDIALAVERGELDGMCVGVASIEAKYKHLIDGGKMKLIIQMGPSRDHTFGNIPSVFDFAKTEEQRKILSLVFDQMALGRPFFAPPSMPADRFAALRKAFAETLKDPAFLEDAKRMKVTINYLSGHDAKRMLEQFADYPPSVVQKARVAIGQR